MGGPACICSVINPFFGIISGRASVNSQVFMPLTKSVMVCPLHTMSYSFQSSNLNTFS
jgi:hypothetical protein